MTADAKVQFNGEKSTYPSLLSEEQIQKVIFDTSYMSFIKEKGKTSMMSSPKLL